MSSKAKSTSPKGLRPKLRFPEFRGAPEWEEKTLGDLCKMQAGKFVPASEIYEEIKEGLYPCYGGNGLRGYVNTYTHTGKYPLIGRQGALCGNINMGMGLFNATEHAVVVTVKENIDVNWLYYQLIRLNLNQYATGQAQPGLSVDILERVPSSFPSDSKEQQRISDCLSSIDDLITAQIQKLDELKNHKKGLMQQLFPAEGETLPKLRFPEFRGAPEWEEKTLGDLCKMQAGKFVPASEIYEEIKEGLYPCYGGNGLRGYVNTYTHTGKYPLIGRQGALCGNINMGMGLFNATEHAVVVTVKENIDVNWLYYQLIRLNLNQYATGQAQPGLSVDILERVPSSFPSDSKEQQRISDCLSSIDDLITAQIQKLDELKNHKKGLMQQLFPSISEVQE